MSRRRKAIKRAILPDSKYNDVMAAKFINCMMHSGKKTVSTGIFYGALEIIQEKIKDVEPLEVFHKSIENIKPMLEVKSRRVGGSNYQVPVEVRPERRISLAMRWLLQIAQGRGEKTMTDRLANELMDAYNNTGSAIKKKEDTHRMAEANKAFAHYRW